MSSINLQWLLIEITKVRTAVSDQAAALFTVALFKSVFAMHDPHLSAPTQLLTILLVHFSARHLSPSHFRFPSETAFVGQEHIDLKERASAMIHFKVYELD